MIPFAPINHKYAQHVPIITYFLPQYLAVGFAEDRNQNEYVAVEACGISRSWCRAMDSSSAF